jgi:hypothetical protein
MGLSVIEEQHNGMSSIFRVGKFAYIRLLTQIAVILQEIKNITQNDVRDRLPLFIPYRSTEMLTQIAANHSGNV